MEVVQYIGGCSVHWRLFSTLGITSVLWGIGSVLWGDRFSTVEWRLFSTVGDSFSTVGDCFSTVEVVQYSEG